jgi:predicted transcriptional regulator
MRKWLVLAVLLGAGVLIGRRLRARSTAPVAPSVAPSVAPAPAPAPAPPPSRPVVARPEPPAGDPPATTNGERVVLMSISTLEERGEDATHDAVVRHVAAGEIDPDEETVEVLLHRLAAGGCLAGGGDEEAYRLTPLGRAALLDGSTARPSAAEDAADELSSPTAEA